jgi:8-oxo-dGTP pyrophosphatase MutT (NUDIX family)
MEIDPYKTKICRPIISYGIILYTYVPYNKKFKFLFIRRKNTFGFIDFLKGNYTINNKFYLQNLFNEMTKHERVRLKNCTFYELWCSLWNYDLNHNAQIRNNNEYIKSNNKFQQLKDSNLLDELIENCPTDWDEPEWEFPKGRINCNEKHLDCSIREFVEETGIKKELLNVIENLLPFEETFIGTNYKLYTYKYYLSNMNYNDYLQVKLNNYQKSEVSKLEWVTIEECISKIRPYNLEKIKLIQNINDVLWKYSLFYG